MSEEQRLVAIISPWEKLSDLVKRKFRIESLPAEKKVMVWREDLASTEALQSELASAGIVDADLRTKKVTARWQDLA